MNAAADQRQRRHRLAADLGLAGSILGVVAGAAQATIGTQVPEWTGAKNSPVALGILTIGLSVLAGIAAGAQRRPHLSVGVRAVCAIGLAGPALLCLTTVGRLWYLPGVLLLAAATLSIDSWKDTTTTFTQNWLRVLLSTLGAFEILMAARAAPLLMATGALGGIALISAAWLRTTRGVLVTLVVVGTVPFAALAWTAVAPVVLSLVAAVLAVPVVLAGPVVRTDVTAFAGQRSDSRLAR